MQTFYVVPQNDGTIVIGAFRPDANALRQFTEIGAKIDGTLTVSLGRGATVVKHNAQSEPWAYGLLGSYKWEIKKPDSNPFMVIRPAKWRTSVWRSKRWRPSASCTAIQRG